MLKHIIEGDAIEECPTREYLRETANNYCVHAISSDLRSFLVGFNPPHFDASHGRHPFTESTGSASDVQKTAYRWRDERSDL
jgi:hypothetical protein